jgi:hypothetical protein
MHRPKCSVLKAHWSPRPMRILMMKRQSLECLQVEAGTGTGVVTAPSVQCPRCRVGPPTRRDLGAGPLESRPAGGTAPAVNASGLSGGPSDKRAQRQHHRLPRRKQQRRDRQQCGRIASHLQPEYCNRGIRRSLQPPTQWLVCRFQASDPATRTNQTTARAERMQQRIRGTG